MVKVACNYIDAHCLLIETGEWLKETQAVLGEFSRVANIEGGKGGK